MEKEMIFMGIEGPKTDTTEQLVAKAAEMLGIDVKDVEVEQEFPGEGRLAFNAAMPAGYYDKHPRGQIIRKKPYRLEWEAA